MLSVNATLKHLAKKPAGSSELFQQTFARWKLNKKGKVVIPKINTIQMPFYSYESETMKASDKTKNNIVGGDILQTTVVFGETVNVLAGPIKKGDVYPQFMLLIPEGLAYKKYIKQWDDHYDGGEYPLAVYKEKETSLDTFEKVVLSGSYLDFIKEDPDYNEFLSDSEE